MGFVPVTDNRANGIDLPRSALRYALLQRPMLQRFTGLQRRIGLPPSLLLRADAALRRRAISDAYSRMIHDDFQGLRPHLPRGAERTLDIGCGIGGLDVLLYRHYRTNSDVEIILLDRTDPETMPRYGFRRTKEFYNALDVSSAVLRQNGVPEGAFRIFDAAEDGAFPDGPLDLVISIASWGFHYPLSTYLEPVRRALRPGGRLILDLRRNQGQEEELERAFADCQLIGPTWNDKAGRYRACKNA